jgi:hypothetical protein
MAVKLGLKPNPLSQIQEICYANSTLGEKVTHYVTCRVQLGSYWKDLNFMGDSVILGTLCFTHLDWARYSEQ